MSQQGYLPRPPSTTNYHVNDVAVLLITLSSTNLGISAVTLIFCGLISLKCKQLLRMTIFQAIVVMQLSGVLKSILELYTELHNPGNDAACRWVTFLSIVLALFPLYTSIFCILYLQMTLIHHVPATKKWPKWLLITGCILFSVVPPSFSLFISPKQAGLKTYCDYAYPPNKRLLVYKWLICFMWIIIAGIIGFSSISILLVNIKKKSREIGKGMPRLYQIRGSYMRGKKMTVKSSNELMVKTLISTIWFPIIPILSLWFASAYSIVKYGLGRVDNTLSVIDIVLQSMEVPFIALTFYTHPPVIRVFQQYKAELKARRFRFSGGFTDTTSIHYEERLRKLSLTRPTMIAQTYDPALSHSRRESDLT